MLNNKVEICGVNTSKLPLLNRKEKEELLIKIKQGDKEARNEFINGNLRLVLSVIQRFYGRGENADDLFQVGCVGLIKAIDNFDSILLSLNIGVFPIKSSMLLYTILLSKITYTSNIY